MLYLDVDDLPSCLVLPRWSKHAKDQIREKYGNGSLYWDSQPAARYSGIVQMSKVVAELVHNDVDEFNNVVDILGGEIRRLKIKKNQNAVESVRSLQSDNPMAEDILDPDIVRTKGCGGLPSGTPATQRRPRNCGMCGVPGHNKRSCPQNGVGGNSTRETQSPLTTTDGTQGIPSESVS
jgi:hypothetical protein